MLKKKSRDLKEKLIIIKRIWWVKAQESCPSIDTKLVHCLFNKAHSQVKSMFDKSYNQMELWKFHHGHLTSIVQGDGKNDPVLVNWEITLLIKAYSHETSMF